MPSRMFDFVAYWRSRGYTRRQGYRLWQIVQNRSLQPRDFRWVERFR